MSHDMLLTVLRQKPLGLVFDIDGTLSPIAPTPESARLYPGVAELLERAQSYAHVGIITGRSIPSAADVAHIEGITFTGNHGVEWCDGLPDKHPIQLVPEAQAYVEPGKYLLDLAKRELGQQSGFLVEYKSVGGTVHYRQAANPEQARQQILDLLGKPAQKVNMRLVEGKFSFEIRIPLTIHKGEALRRFCEHFALKGVLFAGDDLSDLDAILETAQQRQRGLAAYSIAVQHPDTPTALLEHADQVVNGVAGMVQQLDEMINFLAGGALARS